MILIINILINLNNFNPNVEYYNIKKNIIKEYFTTYSNKLNEKLQQLTIKDDNQNIFSNFEKKFENIEKNYSTFVSIFKDIIKQNFTIEKCGKIYDFNSDSDLFTDSDIANSDITD